MDLTEGPVSKRLLELWLPMIVGVIAVKAIDLSDAYFVGQLGQAPLAAVSFTFPIVMTLVSISIGISAGGSSVLSRAVGGHQSKEQKQALVACAVGIALLASLAITVIGILVGPSILKLMGAKQDVLALAESYLHIWFLGVGFLIVPVAINGLLRATGGAVVPAGLMTGTAIVNIALNPIMIFGWGPVQSFGIEGAAYATILARVPFTMAAFYLLLKRELLVLNLALFYKGLGEAKRILRIAAPASLSTSLNPVAMSVLTAGAATLGVAEVAAFGIVSKIQAFASVPLLALSSATSPFAGQNSGAQKMERTRTSLYLASGVSVGWSILLAVFFWFFSAPLVELFNATEQAKQSAVQYLQIVPLSIAGYGITIALSAAMNGLGRGATALLIGGGRALCLLAPLGYVSSVYFGFVGLSAGIALANTVAGIVALLVIYKHSFKPAD